jgi:hypothetical protein
MLPVFLALEYLPKHCGTGISMLPEIIITDNPRNLSGN